MEKEGCIMADTFAVTGNTEQRNCDQHWAHSATWRCAPAAQWRWLIDESMDLRRGLSRNFSLRLSSGIVYVVNVHSCCRTFSLPDSGLIASLHSENCTVDAIHSR